MLTSSEEVQEAVRRWVIALARTSHKLGGYCCIAPGSRDPEPPQHPHLGTLATRGAVANREPEGEDGDSGGHQKGSACGHRPGYGTWVKLLADATVEYSDIAYFILFCSEN
uniref:Uncharacterized protein n=1 Tax=Heliothis virescens TaxID=7102 RepID=A0A2A4J8I4_HELVI